MSEETPKKPWNASDNPWLERLPKEVPIPRKPRNDSPRRSAPPPVSPTAKSYSLRTTSKPKREEPPQPAPAVPHPLLKPLLKAIRDGATLPRGISRTLLTAAIPSEPTGATPLHLAAQFGNLDKFSDDLAPTAAMLVQDQRGETPIHHAVTFGMLNRVPVHLLTRENLAATDNNGISVVDAIASCGASHLLPPEMLYLTRHGALRAIQEKLEDAFCDAADFHQRFVAGLIPEREFAEIRSTFVRRWVEDHTDLSLDQEQADAVAEYGSHIQVTARAGSGKTRTLVARSLFQIKHCHIPASSILILAFNKKAVEEIRERLLEHLSEVDMPHVLTFHALAYRIVKPQENLVYDEGESKEGQVFSTTIQRIIDEEVRGGTLELKLRELMEARWNADLSRIIELGFNLPQEKFLAHRLNLSRTTMNGRRVNSEAHKHIGNSLLRLGLGYSYRHGIHRAAGTAYVPDFSHYHKEGNQRFLIEVIGEEREPPNAAEQAFWKSERSDNTHLIQFREAECQDPEVTLENVTKEFASRGVAASPMNDAELWKLLRDDAIRNFTKTVRGFISRCQKELISPDSLDRMLPDDDPELWTWGWISDLFGFRRVRVVNIKGLQVRFWRLCSGIYSRYRQLLAEQNQTDFDQLMLNAAGMIREGQTGFKSARGSGDIRQIRHLLIDEFQDFSHLFNELRKSIVLRTPEATFFCVGDDWQAINKFAGSNLRYFTGFSENFTPSVRKLITRNYRSCRAIVKTGNRVMHGLGEPSIPNSSEQGTIWRVEAGEYSNLTEAEETVLEELGENALVILRIASYCTSRGESVTILSRTSSFGTPEGMLSLDKWQDALRYYLLEKQRGMLEVSTTHGYKGKEADVIILLDPEGYPFVHPDSIFVTIFGDTFDSIVEDERRLFYVAVTRPKKTLFLLSDPSRYSQIQPYTIRFLEDAYPPAFDINRLKSNLLCGSRVVLRLTTLARFSENGGTYPIKDRLKEAEFKWKEETKSWSTFLEQGSINSPFECVEYLNAQPWIREADGVVATFAWADQQHRMHIVAGRVTLNGSPSKTAVHGTPWNGRTDSESPANRQNKMPLSGSMARPEPASLPSKSVTGTAGVFETRVVGMRYERRMIKASHLSAGNFVRLEREPGNIYDKNAIKVVTTEGFQIGYLSRHVATHLASGLDAWGGTSQAKVTSVRTQPPPHSLVSIQICFPLPPGVVIPQELDATAYLDDSPFRLPKHDLSGQNPPKMPTSASSALSEPVQTEPVPSPPSMTPPESGSPDLRSPFQFDRLSPSQRADLENLITPDLAPLLADLYLSAICPWPEIGYEALDSTGACTGSMLEVAWPNHKIGVQTPMTEVGSFLESGWVILPSANVSAIPLRSLFSPESDQMQPTGYSPSKNADPDNRFQHGPFFDHEPDDDIPF
jgi:DNA helicase-4